MPIHVDVPASNDPGSNLTRHLDEATDAVLSGLHQHRQGQEFDLPAAELAVGAAYDDLVEAIEAYRVAIAAVVATAG